MEVYTKCTFITPQYIFVNQTNYPVQLTQSNKIDDSILEVLPNARIPIEWAGGFKDR